MVNKSEKKGAVIIYDGQCPFCTYYVTHVRLVKAVGDIEYIDARLHPDVVAECRQFGYNLDDGMLLKLGGQNYFGADCINVLAALTSQSDIFNRLNYRLFRSVWIARFLYPVLRAGRNATLFLLGRKKIEDSEKHGVTRS